MAINELLALVPPPPRTNESVEVFSWQDIEAALKTRLPGDYRDFGRTYGSGQFEDGTFDFLVINPLAERYLEIIKGDIEIWQSRRESAPTEFPAELFPAEPGMLPWGMDVDGGMMGWLRIGDDPEQWSVVTKGSDDDSFEEFKMSFTTFMAKALRREIRPRLWRPDFPEDIRQVVFRPIW